MKILFRLLLSLSFLLFGGYGYLFANSPRNTFPHTTPAARAASQITILQSKPEVTMRQALPRSENGSDDMDDPDSEDEDDDPTTAKKQLAALNNSSILFWARPSGSFLSARKQHFSFSKHFSCSLSCRYIIFRSIRI